MKRVAPILVPLVAITVLLLAIWVFRDPFIGQWELRATNIDGKLTDVSQFHDIVNIYKKDRHYRIDGSESLPIGDQTGDRHFNRLILTSVQGPGARYYYIPIGKNRLEFCKDTGDRHECLMVLARVVMK